MTTRISTNFEDSLNSYGNGDAQEKNKLASLKRGDAIIVTYNQGNEREREFIRFTPSGSVVYEQDGRERKCPAEFVKIKK